MAPAASSAPPRLVLFVTAHPDDEAMFFAPAIAHFSAQAASAQRHRQAGGDAAAGSADEAAAAAATGDGVYLLCLSTGAFVLLCICFFWIAAPALPPLDLAQYANAQLTTQNRRR